MERLSRLESKEKYNDFEKLIQTIFMSESNETDKKIQVQLLIIHFESLNLTLSPEQEFRIVSLKCIAKDLICYNSEWKKNMFDARRGVPIYPPKKIPLIIDDLID